MSSKPKSIGWRELSAAGFKPRKGFRADGAQVRYYLADTPAGESVVMLRQSKYRWHCFYCDMEATASGGDPRRALDGGLGDVIGSDSELRTYSRLVLAAPARLLQTCAGLYAASSQVFNG